MNKIVKLVLLPIFLSIFSNATATEKINEIIVNGNQKIETSEVKEYCGLYEGQDFSSDFKNNAIKRLYATSMFKNISMHFNNGILKIFVKERHFISTVNFSGNSKINSTTLAKEILTVSGESLQGSKIKRDLEKIKEIYKRSGHFLVNVKSRTEDAGNRTVKIIFQINEGPRIGVNSIHFKGNVNLSSSKLKSIIITKESKWFRFLEKNDNYYPERVEYDKYLITKFYNSLGFINSNIISVAADLLNTKEGFKLTYSIDEGDQYRFGNITVNSKLLNTQSLKLEKFFFQKKGKLFNLEEIETISKKISEYLKESGYSQIEIFPTMQLNTQEKIVHITIVVNEANKIFVNRINIEGNIKTEDKVIRSQLNIEEGDIYSQTKIEKGEQNIRNLSYFDKVLLTIEPTNQKDRYDININVKEKSTSSIGLDSGYNMSSGLFARVSFLEKNLLGTGKYLNIGLETGKKNTSYYLGITNPYFLDKDLTVGINFFKNQDGQGSGFGHDKPDYAKTSLGTKIVIGSDITDYFSYEIECLIKQDTLRNTSSLASRFVKEQVGKFNTSSLSHSLTYDRTDSRLLPKQGYLMFGSQEFSGTGGGTKYLKHEIEGKYFKSFFQNNYTVKVSAGAGYIRGINDKKVKISDRFNLGDYSLRGFSFGGIGPRDKETKEGFGGQKYYTFSSELNFPIGLPEEFNLTGTIFVDTGSLSCVDSKSSSATNRGLYNDRSLRASLGFGFIWVTKVAPIRIDWGFPVKRQKYDERQTFHIKFSTHF